MHVAVAQLIDVGSPYVALLSGNNAKRNGLDVNAVRGDQYQRHYHQQYYRYYPNSRQNSNGRLNQGYVNQIGQ